MKTETKYYTVEELKGMGRIKEVGFGRETISRINGKQLTIFRPSDFQIRNQMSLFDLKPKTLTKK